MDLSEFLFNSINEFFKSERSKDKNVILDEFEKFVREKFKNELEKIDNQVDEMDYGFFCSAFKNRDNKILSPDEYEFYKSKAQKEKLKYKNSLKEDYQKRFENFFLEFKKEVEKIMGYIFPDVYENELIFLPKYFVMKYAIYLSENDKNFIVL